MYDLGTYFRLEYIDFEWKRTNFKKEPFSLNVELSFFKFYDQAQRTTVMKEDF